MELVKGERVSVTSRALNVGHTAVDLFNMYLHSQQTNWDRQKAFYRARDEQNTEIDEMLVRIAEPRLQPVEWSTVLFPKVHRAYLNRIVELADTTDEQIYADLAAEARSLRFSGDGSIVETVRIDAVTGRKLYEEMDEYSLNGLKFLMENTLRTVGD